MRFLLLIRGADEFEEVAFVLDAPAFGGDPEGRAGPVGGEVVVVLGLASGEIWLLVLLK